MSMVGGSLSNRPIIPFSASMAFFASPLSKPRAFRVLSLIVLPPDCNTLGGAGVPPALGTLLSGLGIFFAAKLNPVAFRAGLGCAGFGLTILPAGCLPRR